MTGKKQLLFVINPISGGKSKLHVPALIEKHLDHSTFDYTIYWWETVEDLPTAIASFIKQNGYAVVAIGGDGTINSVASCLIHSPVRLAIIPQGSGNGFAREFKISRSIPKALVQLNTASEQSVDVGKMNDKVFVNVAGWGFDAKVSNTFATLTQRGFWSYTKAINKDFGGAINLKFKVQTENETYSKEGFLLTVANGRQWGNNFYIAPRASFTDGIFDLVFIRKPKLYQIPYLVASLYFKLPNRLITRKQIRGVTIQSDKPCYTHVDGEPLGKVGAVNVEVLPGALKVLV